MVNLKDQIEKLEKDVKALVSNQETFREEMKNNNATQKSKLKNEVVLVLEIRLVDKLDVMIRKHKT